MNAVKIRVPGSSANIGPGFDSLGIALSVYNEFIFEIAEKTTVIGCDPAYAGEDNLALVAFRRACEFRGVSAPAVRLTISGEVPVSRGLGSSSTLFVGGIFAADALLSLELTKEEKLLIATELEGHPDNVAPAIYGGMTAAFMSDGKPVVIPCEIKNTYRFCAFIPDFETKTRDARAVLPKTVSYADAVFNISHVAALLYALRTGNAELIDASLRDRLHEPYRKSLIYEFDEVEAAARAEGADAFFISGSGSTLMAIYRDPSFPKNMKKRLSGLSHGWQVRPLVPDKDGARVLCDPVSEPSKSKVKKELKVK